MILYSFHPHDDEIDEANLFPFLGFDLFNQKNEGMLDDYVWDEDNERSDLDQSPIFQVLNETSIVNNHNDSIYTRNLKNRDCCTEMNLFPCKNLNFDKENSVPKNLHMEGCSENLSKRLTWVNPYESSILECYHPMDPLTK